MPDARENELFARFRTHADAEALAELYDLVAQELLRVALHLARDPARAEDLVQQTFVAAIERAGAFDAGRPVRAWLLGILANQARKAHRDAARVPSPARDDVLDPHEIAAANEFTAQVDAAIAALPLAYQPVLVLHLKHGMIAAEIAHALRRPPGTVRTQIVRGLELLKKALPAGLALGALAALGTAATRGLAAVRAAVLTHARFHAGTATATATGGLLAMKKAAVGLAAFVAVALGWMWLAGGAGNAPSREADASGARGDPVAEAVSRPTSRVAREAIEPPQTQATAGTVRVIVLHASDRAPAAGVGVSLAPRYAPPGEAHRVWKKTDARGEATFECLGAGELDVGVDRNESARLTLRAGERASTTLLLPQGVLLRGRVVDEQHVPLGGASVFLAHGAVAREAAASTDPDGRFELRDVGPRCQVTARAPGHAGSGTFDVRGNAADTDEIELILASGGATLQGEVVGEDGAPVRAALVRVAIERDTATRYCEQGRMTSSVVPEHVLRADAQGCFLLDGLPPGTIRVSARSRGLGATTQSVPLEPAQTAKLRLVLARGARISGTVLGPDGLGLVGVEVQARLEPDDPFTRCSARSATGGAFELVDVTPGAVRVAVPPQDCGRCEEALAVAGGSDLRIELRPTSGASADLVMGRVLGPNDAPRSGWSVLLVENAELHEPLAASTKADGSFVLAGAAGHSHRLLVTPPTGVWKSAPVVREGVVAGGTQELVIRVPAELRPAQVVARVTTAAGEPLAGARLRCFWASDLRGLAFDDLIGPPGTARVEGLPPGRYRFVVEVPGYAPTEVATRELASGESCDLGTVTPRHGSSVAVVVRRADGKELRDPRVQLFGAGGLAWLGEAHGASLRFADLQAGTYRIAVADRETQWVMQDCELRAGEETRAEVVLPRSYRCRFAFEVHEQALGFLRADIVDASGQIVWPLLCKRFDHPRFAAEVWLQAGDYRLETVGGVAWSRTPFRVEARDEQVVPIDVRKAPALQMIPAVQSGGVR